MTEPSQHNHPRRNLLGGTVSRPPGPSLWKNQPLESGSATDRSRLLQLLQFLFQTQLLLLFILQSHAIATGKKRCYICVPPQKKMKRLPKSWRGWCLDQKKIWGFGQQWSRLLKARPKVPILILLHPILVLVSEPVGHQCPGRHLPMTLKYQQKTGKQMQKKNI